jgi:glutamine synthetase
MTTAKNVLKMIKDNDMKYADFRFTDPRGKWQHLTFDIGMIEEETFSEGRDHRLLAVAGRQQKAMDELLAIWSEASTDKSADTSRRRFQYLHDLRRPSSSASTRCRQASLPTLV